MSNSRAGVVAGIVAGVFATLVELILWWLAGLPLPETLFRDARLAAAIVLGPAALVPQPAFDWRVMLTATLLHFSLSVAYAGCLSIVIARASWRASLAAGALFGLALFAMNMYGFALIFPWFAVTRDWITAAAHLVFGVVAAAMWKATQMRRPETGR
jgi:hypothetical protein